VEAFILAKSSVFSLISNTTAMSMMVTRMKKNVPRNCRMI
jgi:hypothetical protein